MSERADHRILVRSTNWIGDVVMSLPALREIRRLFPESQITLFGRKWVGGVLAEQKLVDELLLLGNDQRALPLFRQLEGYDLAILLQNAFEAALMTFLARIPERAGYSVQGRGPLLTRKASPRIGKLKRHQVYYYLDLLFQTGLSPVDYLAEEAFSPDISLIPGPRGQEEAERLCRSAGVDDAAPLVGLNPGATFGPAKRWMTDRYVRLADRLMEAGYGVAIVGSAAEKPLAAEIRRHMQREPVIFSGRTTLEGLIALIARCSLFITNDSGPMHLAAALDVPQIALFGSTDEIATGPFNPRARVIHKHVECSPCFRRECPIDLRCFTAISVDEVFEAAREVLES